MVGGSKRRSSTAAPPTPSRPVTKNPPSPLTAEELTPFLDILSSALSGSLRFRSSADLALLPSQYLDLDSSIAAAAESLSGLLSVLPPHSLSIDLPPPPSAPWFSRFLASAAVDDVRWAESFRMSKRSFGALLQSLYPALQSDLSVPADVKLGAALFRLAHAAPYRAVAHRFGLPSQEAACRSFYEVCKAAVDRLGHLFEFSSDLERVVRGFDRLSLPNCCGVLGFTRFTVEGTARGGSIVAQGLVDSEGRFLDISVGWHGSTTPAEIVTKSKLSKTQALLLGTASSTRELNGGSLPKYLLGGSCCPLLHWLLTPYRDGESSSNSSKAATFNHFHACAMELVNRAFARLRMQWRLLPTSWKEECVQALPYVVVTSCLLHNFLIKSGDFMADGTYTSAVQQEFPNFDGKDDENGQRIREILATHLARNVLPFAKCNAANLWLPMSIVNVCLDRI
ncbi:hypothetical protein ZIOFF_044749 [Zingiber officinale]|uniref:DDE Tnp4 domain-containing protein n=1 Tax=Zingiber officinale TaxID=94328 RepID=A0A8J5G2Q0_ZINOF|nr:hypothetical protein ZIOFF_044749 [Zingiber officinale]